MEYKDLVDSAQQLKTTSIETNNEYNHKTELLISIINEQILKREDIHDLIGSDNIEMMKNNHSNHVKFMLAIFQNFNAEVFTDTILWVFRVYQNHGFQTSYWEVQLTLWTKILKQNFSNKAFTEILPYYEWMLNNISIFNKLTNTEIG